MLSADFALGAEGLVIDGFDASSDVVTVAQVGDRYTFTLNGGVWNNLDSVSGAAVVAGQTLSVDIAVLAPLAAGVRVAASPGTNLSVLFDDVDFSDLSGPVTIDGASSLAQVAGATFTGPENSVLAVVTPAAGLVLNSFDSATDFVLEVNGPITDTPGTEIRIQGDATLISRSLPGVGDLDASGFVDGDDIGLWMDGFGASGSGVVADPNLDGFVNAADFTILRDIVGVAASGGDGGITLADNPGDVFEVAGNVALVAESTDGADRFPISIGADSLVGGSHTASGAQVGFGSLSVSGGGTVVFEQSDPSGVLPSGDPAPANNGTVIDDSDVESFYLVSAGPITDTPTADVAVSGAALFNSTTDDQITLDAVHQFGTLTFDGGAVTIVEQEGIELAGFSEAESLVLEALGSITDSADGTTTLLVENNASFTATNGDILLDDTHDFGSLTFSGGDVAIVETTFVPVFPVGGPAGGPLASVAPAGGGTILSGVSTANSLGLNSDGAITDDGSADVAVIGNASFNAANGDEIVLDDEYRFGSLTVNGGATTVAEADDTVLSGASRVASLALSADGSIVDDDTADVEVTGNASFDSLPDEAIVLDDAYRFGSLSFDGGAVLIREADGTELVSGNSADSLDLESAGDIVNTPLSALLVTNNASFTAINGDAILINESILVDFGSLTFNGGFVAISELIGSTVLSGVSSASQLNLVAGDTISDDGTAELTVAGNARFESINTQAITLNGVTYNFGTLTFVGGDVLIVEGSDTVLAGDSIAASLILSSNGSLTDALGASLGVLGNASLISQVGEAITLDGLLGFDSLTFNGGAVAIAESSSTLLTGVSTADSLDLESAGSIADSATADVTVIGNARFESTAGIAITLDALHQFGSLTFVGGAVEIVEQDGTELAGDSVADSLTLTSLGDITDAADATLAVATFPGTAVFVADGSIVLADAGAENRVSVFDVSFNAGAGAAATGSVLVGVNPDGSPSDAVLLITLLNFTAQGPAMFGIDGGLAPPVPPPLPAVDEALAQLVLEDELSLDGEFDLFAA